MEDEEHLTVAPDKPLPKPPKASKSSALPKTSSKSSDMSKTDKPLPKTPSKSSGVSRSSSKSSGISKSASKTSKVSILSPLGEKKRSPPPIVPRRDYAEEEDEWDDNSTFEYKSSANDLPEGEESLNLRPPKPIGQNLRFTKSAKLLAAYGITSIILGLGVASAGVASFVYGPDLARRHSFQMEWKWSNLFLLLSGLAALFVTYRQTLTGISTVLVSSLVAGAMGAGTAVVHVVNVHFRRLDASALEAGAQDPQPAHDVGATNVVLVIIGVLSAGVSVLQYRHCLHIAGKNFGFNRSIERRRLRLSLLGMAQIFLGIAITGWWVAIEALFQGHNADFHSLPTSEVLSHGLVLIAAGYVQMMGTAKGSQPLLLAATLLNGAAAFLAAYFSAKPISLIYLTMEMNASTGEDALDIKFAMFAILTVFYVLEVLVSVYSLIKFIHLAAGDRISRLDHMMERSRRLIGILCMAQVSVGALYALLETISVGLLFAYKMDFSALPLLVLGTGLLGWGSLRLGSAPLLSLTLAGAAFCAAHSLRDVYLFVFHASLGGAAPAELNENGRVAEFSGGVLALHFIIALVALAELLLSSALGWVIARSLIGSVATLINRIQMHSSLWALKLIAMMQMIGASLGVVGGLSAFFASAAYLEVLGDIVTTTSLLMLIGAVLGLLAVAHRRMASLLLPALATQSLAFLLIWQQMDELAFLVHNHLNEKAEDVVAAEVGEFSLASALLVTLLLLWLLTALSLLLIGELVEESKMSKVEGGRTEKTAELVDMRDEPSVDTKDTQLIFQDDPPTPPAVPKHGE